MHVKRFADAKPYEAPNHRGVVGLRLQGFEPGGPTTQWIGYSQFLPGGGAGPDSTPFEKVYVVLSGQMTVRIDGKDQDSDVVEAGAQCGPARSPVSCFVDAVLSLRRVERGRARRVER